MAFDFDDWNKAIEREKRKKEENRYYDSLPEYTRSISPEDRKYYEYVDDYRDGRDSVWRKKKMYWLHTENIYLLYIPA